MERRKDNNSSWQGPHFVVVGGYDRAHVGYRDYDPGRNHPYPAQGFNQIYLQNEDESEANYQLLQLIRYKTVFSHNNTLDSRILLADDHSPVEMLVIDPQGRRTGYDLATGTQLVENPMSRYSIEEPVGSLDPADPPGEPVTIQYDSISLIQEILTELAGITTTNTHDAERLAESIEKLQSLDVRSETRKNAKRNIQEIIEAAEKLKKLSIDTSAIRLKLDELLKIWERKWYLAKGPWKQGGDE